MGSVKGMYLDHTTPLGLGGDNSKKNLRLVSEADWKRYTKIENSLMKMVKEKKMTMKEAKKFIVDYKNGIAEVLDINSYIK